MGDANHSSLLFIHGWGGASRYFLDVMSDLSDTHRCLAVDLPGFGDTPPLPAQVATAVNTYGELPYSHRGLARYLALFLDALDIVKCDVIGHSYGSGVAIALAAQFPERVGRVVISNFSTFRHERERRVVALMHHVTGAMMLARKLPFAKTDWFARSFGARYFHALPKDMQVLRDGVEDFMRMNDEAARLTVRDSLGWETPHDLARLSQPVLSIHCRQDQIMPPRNAEFTAALAPHGQLAWIDNCGHMPMIECCDEWVRLVREFLNHNRHKETRS
jgi:pimeloyl-ACP methyl ester carboxylesterase